MVFIVNYCNKEIQQPMFIFGLLNKVVMFKLVNVMLCLMHVYPLALSTTYHLPTYLLLTFQLCRNE